MSETQESYYQKRMAEKMRLESINNSATENIVENKDNINQTIIMIAVDKLDSFENHIFSKLPDSKFEELKDSIKRNGVLSPIIVREKQDRYEIISGHNRNNCCKELGITEIPSIVKDYDDMQAELIMIETNLAQRENILPVEKGVAYKTQLKLLKDIKREQSKNASFDSDTNSLEETVTKQQLDSIDELSNNSNDGRTTIQKLIRLVDLSKDLQNKVNIEELSIGAGVELSYISLEEQAVINSVLNDTKIQLSIIQAEKLRANKGNITTEIVKNILTAKTNKIKKEKFTGKIDKPIYTKYKDKFNTDKEFSQLIQVLLEKYFNSIENSV